MGPLNLFMLCSFLSIFILTHNFTMTIRCRSFTAGSTNTVTAQREAILDKMGPIEQCFYDKIHQRCPVDSLVKFLRNSDGFQLRMDVFVVELQIVRSRNPFYAKNVFKSLIDNLDLFDEEATGTGIPVLPAKDLWLSEWLYEQYVELLSVGQPAPTTKDVIQYPISKNVKVKIEETPYLISASGTTGFRTWEAALYLAFYLTTQGTDLVGDNCCILELGAGTGLVSAALSLKYADRLSKQYVTDGDSQLTQQLDRNFRLNDIDTSTVSFRRLWWNEDPVPDEVNLVVAADVTYDSTVIPDLCRCIQECLSRKDCHACLVSATIRNEDTTDAFERYLAMLGLACEVISDTQTVADSALDTLMSRPLLATIRIYSIRKNDSPNARLSEKS